MREFKGRGGSGPQYRFHLQTWAEILGTTNLARYYRGFELVAVNAARAKRAIELRI